MGGWSDTDNKANLSPVSLRYAANGAVAELGNSRIFSKGHIGESAMIVVKLWHLHK